MENVMQFDMTALQQEFTRRQFFRRNATGIGAAALGSLLNPQLFAKDTKPDSATDQAPHFPGKAKTCDLSLHARRPVTDGTIRL